MYLSAVTLYEFGQFLQILVWIFIPMFVITALITTYIHYRRKRKEGGENELQLVLAKPSQVSEDEDDSYDEESTTPYEGLLWMKNKYEQYQVQTDARYDQLKEKLKESEKKVLELKEALELKGTLNLKEAHETEGANEADKSAAVESKTRLNGVNNGADETGPDPKEENRTLRERLSELASVEDLIGEKDSQIRFLQNQLEQRIKNYHLIEYQGREDKNRITELQTQLNKLQEEAGGLQAERDLLKKQINGLQGQINELNEQVNEQQGFMTKAGQLTVTVQELTAKIQELNGQLEQEKDKTTELTLKLQNNSGLLMNIYNELDRSLREGKETPVPILLEQELESMER